MNFKNYHINSIEKLYEKQNEFLEQLFESGEDHYNLTSNGKMQFEKSFDEFPSVSKSTNFLVLNPANEDDKKKISAYKKKTGYTRVVFYTMTKSRIVKPSPDTNFYNISKEFITSFPLKVITQEQKDLLKTIDSREDKRKQFGKTSSDIYFKITDDEILTFLEILKNSNPSKFSRGVYYVYDLENAELYEVIYNKKDSKFNFDSLFELSKPYQGEEIDKEFKISRQAQHFEEVQVLGLFFDAKKMLKQIQEFQSENPNSTKPYEYAKFKNIVKPFETALEKSNELKDFNEVLKRDYKNFGYNDWYGICYLAGGMTEFRRDIVKDEPYILFKSVPKFIELESDKLGYKDDEDSGKVSTLDVVISNIESNSLLELLKDSSTKLVPNKDGSIFIEDQNGKVLGKYWQVTLKESIKSKIGRGQRFFGKIHKMVLGSKEVFESYDEILNESILDKLTDVAKKGAKFLKEIGKNLFDKIKYLILAFKEYVQTIQKKLSEQISKNVVENAYDLFDLGLNENNKKIINEILIDVLMNPEEHYKKANLKIDRLVSSMMKKQHESTIIKFKEPTEPTKYTASLFKKMIFNYSFLLAFKNVITDTSSPLEKYVEELLDLYVEAVFGATRMPLWKVYSTQDDHKPYEFVGTKSEMKELRKGNILKTFWNNGMPLIELNIGTGKGGANSISLSILSNMISENGKFEPMYTKYEVTFSNDTFECNFIAIEEYPAIK